jgi:hypothetical protein
VRDWWTICRWWRSGGPFASSCPAIVNVLGPSKTTASIDPRDQGLPCYYNNWTIIYVLNKVQPEDRGLPCYHNNWTIIYVLNRVQPELTQEIRDYHGTTIIGQHYHCWADRGHSFIPCSTAHSLTIIYMRWYCLDISERQQPLRPVLTNSARSYWHLHDFLMYPYRYTATSATFPI